MCNHTRQIYQSKTCTCRQCVSIHVTCSHTHRIRFYKSMCDTVIYSIQMWMTRVLYFVTYNHTHRKCKCSASATTPSCYNSQLKLRTPREGRAMYARGFQQDGYRWHSRIWDQTSSRVICSHILAAFNLFRVKAQGIVHNQQMEFPCRSYMICSPA